MKKLTLLLTFFTITFFLSNSLIAQDKITNGETAQFFYSNSNGSTSDPMLTKLNPNQSTFSPEKTDLLDKLDKARLSGDFEKISQLQKRLNEIDNVNEITNSLFNPLDAGMLETEQHFTSTEVPFYAPNYFRSTIQGGGFWSVATFTSHATTALFAAVTEYVNGSGDILKIYISYDNGVNWVLKGTYNGFATTVDYRPNELDIEAITNGTDTLVFAVAGYNYSGHSFSQVARFDIVSGVVNSTSFTEGGLASEGNNKYNPRITSDNSRYASSPYVYITTARDSVTTPGFVHRSYWYGVITAPLTNNTITYRNPNGTKGFWWYSSSISDSTYLYQDIGYLYAGISRVYTLFNHAGSAQGKSIYLAYSNDYGVSVSKSMTLLETQDVLSAKIAADGNNPNLAIGYRRFFGPDWDYRCQYSTVGGDTITAFTPTYPEYTSVQSPMLIDLQSIKNSDGGYVFSWVNADSTMRYRRTNNAGTAYNTSIQVADLIPGDTRFGGAKAGYINSDGADSSLVVWSGVNGGNAYASYNLYTPVAVDDEQNGIPLVYSLNQNYPNPFNPNTIIKFSLPEQTNVTLKIFNSIGQEVATLLNGEIAAGNHQVDFNASALSSGVYFYRISSANFTNTKKMILIK
jgi:hypothetical protein